MNTAVFLVIIAILAAWSIYLYFQLRKINGKFQVLFRGTSATDLEGVLFTEIKHLKKTEKELRELIESSKFLRKLTEKSIQKVGFVRFNPFKETGGDQSFVVALLDYHDNGVVISSLYTRQGTRTYGKPIKNGVSKHQLSGEEIEALKRAGVG